MFTQLVLQSTKLSGCYRAPMRNAMWQWDESVGPIALNGPNSWPFHSSPEVEQTISAKHLVKFPLLLWSTCFFALIYVCKLERNIAPLNKIKGVVITFHHVPWILPPGKVRKNQNASSSY